MNNIKIKKISSDEIDTVVDIWYKASIQAHGFIPNEYWEKNKISMKNEYIPMSETYVAMNEQEILGFISLLNEYLAALFVKPEIQGTGIGSLLINHGKSLQKNLQLKVYSKNKKSIQFYLNNNFSIISESTDETTGEKELLMN